MKRLCYILVLGLVLMAPPVKADPITYDFHGVLAGEEWWPDWVIRIEGPVVGRFTVDADADPVLGDTFVFRTTEFLEFNVFGYPSCGDLCKDSYAEFSPSGLHLFGRNFFPPDAGKQIELRFAPPDPTSGSMVLSSGTAISLSYPGQGEFTSGWAHPVPEPASLLLFGTGLVGLRAWRKRRW